MRTVVVKNFGGPEAAELIGTELPALGADQLRIRVAAAAVHPADLLTRSGALAALLPERPHYTLGWDLSGTVDAVGAEVTSFAVGEPVVALSDWFATLNGTQAEYVVLPATAVAPAPTKATEVEAATLPLNGLTAAQALDLIGLAEGATLLVTGGAGGVGGFAVELAVSRGLRVIAVAGIKDQAFVTGLGAQWVERGEQAAEAVRALVPGGVDGVFDTALVGSPLLAAVRDGGVFVNVFPPAAPVAERGIRVDSVGVHSDGAQLAALSELVDQGSLTLRPARTFAAAEVAAAHTLLAGGGQRGGVVLTF
ncbi:NADP-dependent oxidoreductase [Kitasatospora sp. NBC_01287]|uniref:NADP-dependent oxidoreductase n=1 Tax=Kitasatospora sp. NBC_01287 TaxID=2903573 RepID=UPI00224FDDC6|nr:NADP-dependent oxidoreductase [Kitasatospora sp. NBC_01287]MCX4747737.1 NADP-dependent oxidoreductase [Kitasatospora sp. NBC_01287]